MGTWKMFRCLNCGHMGEFDINILVSHGAIPICNKCKNIMFYSDENEPFDVANQIEKNEAGKELPIKHIPLSKQKETPEIKEMKLLILKLGNNKMWKRIEAYKKARLRLQERELFFKAGGEVPKRKVQI